MHLQVIDNDLNGIRGLSIVSGKNPRINCFFPLEMGRGGGYICARKEKRKIEGNI